MFIKKIKEHYSKNGRPAASLFYDNERAGPRQKLPRAFLFAVIFGCGGKYIYITEYGGTVFNILCRYSRKKYKF